MPTYFSIFGKTPALSAAEIFAVFAREGLSIRPTRMAASGMIFETPKPLADNFWAQFGGIVKAGEVIAATQEKEAEAIAALLQADILERVPSGKIFFGVSPYPVEPGFSLPANAIGTALKRSLQKEDRSVRHVTSKIDALSAVTVQKNKLLGPGAEYCLLGDRAQIAIGRTTWVQDYEEFSFREFARPASNARSGMVPLKLGRALVNLTAIRRDATLLDPFCGSGTIIAEALALGQQKTIASDIDARAVRETRENIAWIKERTGAAGEAKIFCGPAERLHETLEGKAVDAIATEPYLGPPQRGELSAERMGIIERDLGALYLSAFVAFAKFLPKNAPVVFIFPIFQNKKKTISSDIVEKIQNAGFAADPLVPERFRHTPGFIISPNSGVIYSRPTQRVSREILRFRKT